MILIKDSMVLIHLAKTGLLEESCNYFGMIVIPVLVRDEVLMEGHYETLVIYEMIEKKKIKVKSVRNKLLVKKANEFNIQRGEAEAVALYWELKADLIATDDDNVRKKRDVLSLNIIGTPAIILKLYNERKIQKQKLLESVKKLKEIGWFSNTVWDKVRMEVDGNG